MSLVDAERYLAQVRRSEKALGLLTQAALAETPTEDVSDWVVTIHFYILCVYLKALGRCRGMDFQDHYAIRQWLNTESDLLSIARPYRKVEEWSRDSRYEGQTFAPPEISRFHSWFEDVRDHVVRLLRAHGIRDVPVVRPVDPHQL